MQFYSYYLRFMEYDFKLSLITYSHNIILGSIIRIECRGLQKYINMFKYSNIKFMYFLFRTKSQNRFIGYC